MSETLIHDACRRGNIDEVRALIAADPITVDAYDEHGWRPIFHAGLWGHEDVVRLLLEAGAGLSAQQSLMEFLAQYPDDARYAPVIEALRRHTTRA